MVDKLDTSQKVPLSKVVEEVKKSLENNDKWPGKLQGTLNRLGGPQKIKDDIPIGGIDIPLKDIWVNYNIQRDVSSKHVMGIVERLLPGALTPSSAVEIVKNINDPTGIYYVYDGQHRAVICAILGLDSVRCSVKKTTDHTFPAHAFRIVNESGVKDPSRLDLYRTSLYRLEHGGAEALKTKDVREAQRIQEIGIGAGFDYIDMKNLKIKRRQAERKYDHFFTAISYVEKEVQSTDGIGDEAMINIFKAIKEVYPAKKYPEIEQGTYFALRGMVIKAQEKNNTLQKRLEKQNHPNWMVEVLHLVKEITGDPKRLQQACRKQHKFHRNGGGLSEIRFMSSCFAEIYLKYANPLTGLPHLPYSEDDVGILKGNLHPLMKTILKQYEKKLEKKKMEINA